MNWKRNVKNYRYKMREYYDLIGWLKDNVCEIKANQIFKTSLCLCSCSISPNIHNPDCPNFGKKDDDIDIELIIYLKNGKVWYFKRENCS
jgi:hypothetical protein